MNTTQPFPVKKAFLHALCWSVGLSALLGIVAILSGRFGWFEVRILLTTISISVGSICGLASGAYLAVARKQPLPWIGIALTMLAVSLVVFGIWMESSIHSDNYWKLAASASVFAVACAHLSLLSMARLAEWFRWSMAAAYVTILGVAGLIVLMIVGEADGVGMFQLLGVAAIVDAAITILIPIFHRLSKSELVVADNAALSVAKSDRDLEIERLRKRLAELEAQQS